MSWVDVVRVAADRIADWLEPDAPADDGSRRHRRGVTLWTPRSTSSAAAYRETLRTLHRWERALNDTPGPRWWPSWDDASAGWTVRQAEQHALVLGATRAGKSQIMARMLRSALAQGWRVVVTDAKGEYTSAYGGLPGVAMLAPWDARSLVWTLHEDVSTRGDAHDLAQTLLPPEIEGRDPFWARSARGVVHGVLLHEMSKSEPFGWGDVWRWIARGRGYVVQQFTRAMETAPTAEALASVGGKTSTSASDVWKTVTTYLNPIADLAAAWPTLDGSTTGAWSARRWVEGAHDARLLILPLAPRFSSLAATTARLVVEAIARAVLSLPDDPGRRIMVLLDEFTALGRVEAVADLVRRGAAKGVAIVIGIQDLGSMRAVWGRDLTEAMVSSCGSLFALRLSDPSLSEWAARAIAGRRELEERLHTTSRHDGGSSGSTTQSEQVRVADEWVVRPEQIASQPAMCAYVRVAGWPHPVHLAWRVAPLPARAPAVVEADWVRRPLTPLEEQPPPEEPPRRHDLLGGTR
jgi:type IV secretory pathway TraG/TraD family ATPase VirD4